MNTIEKYRKIICMLAAVLLGCVGLQHAWGYVGEAIVVEQVGSVRAKLQTGSAHGRTWKTIHLADGSAVGESDFIITGDDGRACVVLSPGALLCIAPDTEIVLSMLRHESKGLPKSSDDIQRRIHIQLNRGRILIHTSSEPGLRDIRVMVEGGEVTMNMGTVVVAQQAADEWIVVSEDSEVTVTPDGSDKVILAQNEGGVLKVSGDSAQFEKNEAVMDSELREFEVCEVFFDDLDDYIADPVQFDKGGLTGYIGSKGGVNFVGSEPGVLDVSPSSTDVPRRDTPALPPINMPSSKGRWGERKIWDWYEKMGPIKGFNYTPRYAVNSTEFWMEESFDADVIDEELGWAQDAGYTAVRVQLQYVVWENDRDGFMDRLNEFMEVADKHDLVVVPVMFDDKNLAGDEPFYGPQPEPVPGKHNAHWVPSPGYNAVTNRDSWPLLEEFTEAVIKKYRKDSRVAFWDLYNRAGDGGLWEDSLPFMEQVFNWARDVDPSQPVAVPAWSRPGSAMMMRKLERSDLITFHSFDRPEKMESMIEMLKQYNRPIVCSDWLLRQQGNTFEKILPLFAQHGIGWFNRGLVQGATQEYIQQDQMRSDENPDLWQHDVLKKDGDPYDEGEIELIQNFKFEDQ